MALVVSQVVKGTEACLASGSKTTTVTAAIAILAGNGGLRPAPAILALATGSPAKVEIASAEKGREEIMLHDAQRAASKVTLIVGTARPSLSIGGPLENEKVLSQTYLIRIGNKKRSKK